MIVIGHVGAQQKQNICITFEQRGPNVFDACPTLYKCYTNVLCLLGGALSRSHSESTNPDSGPESHPGSPFVEMKRCETLILVERMKLYESYIITSEQLGEDSAYDLLC